jgi:hypothetical protein
MWYLQRGVILTKDNQQCTTGKEAKVVASATKMKQLNPFSSTSVLLK